MARPHYAPRLPLDGMNRRNFLSCSAGAAAASFVLAGAAGCTMQDVEKAASETPLPSGTPVLVMVTLYGGNDGLNTVVPYADSAYQSARPGLAYGHDEVLTLDDTTGLNPGLEGIHGLWGQKKVAIVRGVGYPQPDRSHFRSMDIWQTASPERPSGSGWLGRWLDTAPGTDALLGLNIGPVLPVLAVGEKRTFAALSVKENPSQPLAQAMAALGKPDASDSAAAAAVAASYAALGRVRTDVVEHLDEVKLEDEVTADGSLTSQLLTVAKCIQLGAPTRCYSVSMGGFDTHAGEKGTQVQLLTMLDQAVTKFRAAMAPSPRAKDVVVVVYSEFGRRVKANSSDGTDHGTASDVFVIGDRVKPGFHGEAPSLTKLVDGDLATTTDFRSIYGELAAKVLGTDPARILKGAPAPLGVLV